MRIYYWCPYIGKVATIKAVKNSALALNKYSRSMIDTYLINSIGEWDHLKDNNKYKTISFFKSNKINHLPKLGFLASRFTYLIIFFLTFVKLHNLLKKEKPEYIVVHLVTFTPLLLFYLFNYETKLILRISGYPKLNLLRKYFWKWGKNKIHIITTPTIRTQKLLEKSLIFDNSKLFYLPDPVINIKKIENLKKEKLSLNKNLSKDNSIVSIGRLTKQKNFTFLIDIFKELKKKNKNINLFIIGDGEQKNELKNKIKKLNLENCIFLMGYQKNVFHFLKNSRLFVLCSLWEDPGFVLLEAGYMNQLVLSSDCPNGPREILNNGKNGILYQSGSYYDFEQKFEKIFKLKKNEINTYKLNLKKKIREFTLYNHYKIFNKLLKK